MSATLRKKKQPAKTQVERNMEYKARGRVLPRPKVSAAILRERAELEKDTPRWLRKIFPGIYRQPFGDVHREIIKGADYVIDHGGRYVVIAPRGSGKTYVLAGCLLKAVVQRRKRFPVLIPWAAGGLKKALAFWKKALCFNREFARLYPEWTFPFVASRGTSQRCATFTDEHGAPYGAQLMVSEGMIVFPDSLAVVGGCTLNGNPLGMNYTTDAGEGLRPDVAMIDDPQDREVALSPAQIQQTIQMIDQDIAGMAGADSTMPMMMAATVKQVDDVADHYSRQWRCVRIPQVVHWPRNMKRWEEWDTVRRDGDMEQDGGSAALAFYTEHRAELIEGMEVSWEHRFSKAAGQPDAFYAAMHDYFEMGKEAFLSERQNAPLKRGVTLYDLNSGVVLSRVDASRPAGLVPPWAVLRTAATDINPSYGLTWGVCGYGQDQTAAVLGYGVDAMSVPPGATEAEVARAIYEALVAHGRKLAALPCRPETWVIDAGGSAFDVVLRFAAESARVCGVQAIGATGRGARNYKPFGKGIVGKPREQCHMAVDAKGRKWLAWNADYWKECAQKGWTGSLGAPGSCSLPAGNHRDFAEQVCREQLAAKAEMAGAMRWEWHTAPGPHDYGDVMAMCYMAAAWGGIGTGGGHVVWLNPQRRARGVSVIPL